MAIEIDFYDETEELDEEMINKIQQLIEYAARYENIEEDSEISITIVHNDKIQEINREYRGKDQPTDVISFALEELGEGEIPITGENLPRVLGDIIISLDKAREQAEEYGHSLMRELGFLTVHGFLHLLGYDHETKEEEEIMFQKQEEILNQFGLPR